MRIEQVRAFRTQFRDTIEPLPTEQCSIERLKHFHLAPRESFKRVVLDAVAPWALWMMQPSIRRRAAVEIPVPYDLLSWGDRWARGATQARLLGSIRPRDLSAVLVQGCSFGDGAVQDWLRMGAKRVHGIEIVDMRKCWEVTIPQLKAAFSGDVEFRQALIEEMPYPDAMFDVVTSNAVYEHVYNLSVAARETARVLKPGGRAVHGIGPLYFGYAGDHCISEYGFEAGYDHLLLDEPTYRKRVEDQAFFAKAADPQCRMWAEWNKFSFARLTEYLEAFAPYFDVGYLQLILSPEGVRYRTEYPDRWARLLAAGLTPADLLVKGMNVILRKR